MLQRPGLGGRNERPWREVRIPIEDGELEGLLGVPPGARSIVLFAHGAGSSRLSPRNQYVASVLHEAGFATLLFDLLLEAEEADRANVFDIPLLAGRLAEATRWVQRNPATRGFDVGYFGASTGAAAALVAAARAPYRVAAVVSRGGRPDLAGDALDDVRAPTLLVVGGDDEPVLEMNREAYARLNATKELSIVPDATHLFEEPGALEEVADLAARWFGRHLRRGERARRAA